MRARKKWKFRVADEINGVKILLWKSYIETHFRRSLEFADDGGPGGG